MTGVYLTRAERVRRAAMVLAATDLYPLGTVEVTYQASESVGQLEDLNLELVDGILNGIVLDFWNAHEGAGPRAEDTSDRGLDVSGLVEHWTSSRLGDGAGTASSATTVGAASDVGLGSTSSPRSAS